LSNLRGKSREIKEESYEEEKEEEKEGD